MISHQHKLPSSHPHQHHHHHHHHHPFYIIIIIIIIIIINIIIIFISMNSPGPLRYIQLPHFLREACRECNGRRCRFFGLRRTNASSSNVVCRKFCSTRAGYFARREAGLRPSIAVTFALVAVLPDSGPLSIIITHIAVVMQAILCMHNHYAFYCCYA